MEIIINHIEANKQHPSIVKSWIQDAKNSNILFDITRVKWSYTFCVKVAGMSGSEFVNKLGSGELISENITRAKMSPEEVADEIIRNVVGLSINVFGTGFSREQSLKSLPKLFVEKYRTLIIATENELLEEQKRFENLTPQEKSREEQEMVNELFGTEGVFGLQVGGRMTKQIVPQPIDYDMNEILDKISKVGLEGLTDGEKKFMDEHSKNMK